MWYLRDTGYASQDANNIMKKPPKFLKKYFWDVEFEKMDCKKYPGFVIVRILEHGDKDAIGWMMKNFSETQIVEYLTKTRELTLKSAVFWALILGVKKESIKCLSRSFQEIRRQFWPY